MRVPELFKSFWDREQHKKTEKPVKRASSEEEKSEIRERLNLTNQKIDVLKEELVLLKEGLKLGVGDPRSYKSITDAIVQNEDKIKHLLAERKGLERKILTPKEQAEIAAAREFREVSEAATSERLFGFSEELFREAETKSKLEVEGWHLRWNVAFKLSEIGKADQAEDLLMHEDEDTFSGDKDSLVLFKIALEHARAGRVKDARRVFKEAREKAGKMPQEKEEIAIKVVADYLKGVKEEDRQGFNNEQADKNWDRIERFLKRQSEHEKEFLEGKSVGLFGVGVEEMIKKGRFEELKSVVSLAAEERHECYVLATLGAIVHQIAEQKKRQEEEESMKEVEEELKKAA